MNECIRTIGVKCDCSGSGLYVYPNEPGLFLDRKQND